MSTKLTLTLDKEVIIIAKKFAEEKGQSLSEIVENYFKLLVRNLSEPESIKLSDKVRSLRGILKTDSSFDYKKVLEEEIIKKHG